MRIKCKKILDDDFPREDRGNKSGGLTVNKWYIVLSVYFNKYGLYYQIEDDDGGLVMFKADQFEIFSSYIPSSWETVVRTYSDGTHCLDLSPRNWNQTSLDFYEKISEVSWPLHEWRQFEKIPEVVSLYFQERDLIYREEEEYEKRQSSV